MDLSHLCLSPVIFKCKLKHVILLYPIELPTSYRIKFKCFCIAYKVHHLHLSNLSNSLFVIIFQYFYYLLKFSSVQFSHSVVSDSLRPHESQHARPPCPSPSPGVHSDSCPSSQWCHPAISSSVTPFSSCPQSLPASKSLPMSQLLMQQKWLRYYHFWETSMKTCHQCFWS